MRSTLLYVVPIALLAAAGCATYSDRPLLLRGQIVRQTSPDHYILHDGTRDVLVEIGDRVRAGQHLVPGTHVEVSGEVETRAFKEPKVEARSVIVLGRTDSYPPATRR
jgi:uncharacterized protein YdeI (BOF family)